MKKLIFSAAMLLSIFAYSQTGNVGINTPDPKSTLDIKGSIGLPISSSSITSDYTVTSADHTLNVNAASQVTLTLPDPTTCKGRTYIVTNASSANLIRYNLVLQDATTGGGRNTTPVNGWDQIQSNGTNWIITSKSSVAGTSGWELTGNSGTTAGTNFVGTTDAKDFVMKANGTERIRIASAGNVGVNQAAPLSTLDANGSFGLPISSSSITSDYTVTSTDHTLNVNAASQVTLTLPDPTTCKGRIYIVTNASSANLIRYNLVLQDATTGGGRNTTPVNGWDQIQSNGTNWIITSKSSVAGTSGWGLTGNAGTTPGTNFVGTTDDKDLVFKRNNIQAGLLNNANENTSFGVSALNPTNTGNGITTIGFKSLAANTSGIYNTATGDQSLTANTSGLGNTATGYQSLSGNTTGNYNAASGWSSLFKNTTGFYNTAYGASSLNHVITGSGNTGIGFYAGGLSTGNNNTSIGYNSSNNLISGNGNIAIGANTNFITATVNNQMNIGNTIFGTGMTGSVTTPAGNIGINTATPGASLEVNSLTSGTSGLKFTQMNSSSATTSSSAYLGVDAGGNVVVAPAPNSTSSILGTYPSNVILFVKAWPTSGSSAATAPAPLKAGNTYNSRTGGYQLFNTNEIGTFGTPSASYIASATSAIKYDPLKGSGTSANGGLDSSGQYVAHAPGFYEVSVTVNNVMINNTGNSDINLVLDVDDNNSNGSWPTRIVLDRKDYMATTYGTHTTSNNRLNNSTPQYTLSGSAVVFLPNSSSVSALSIIPKLVSADSSNTYYFSNYGQDSTRPSIYMTIKYLGTDPI